MSEHDVEVVWREFWEPIVSMPGLIGATIDMEQVKRELYDYRVLVKGLSGFFDEITSGAYSKPNTDLCVIAEVIKERERIAYREGFDDGMEEAQR